MTISVRNSLRNCIVLLACLLAASCSRLTEEDRTQAEAAHLALLEQAPGPTPFIVKLTLRLEDFANLDNISFTVEAKPGTFSKPVAVTYTRARIERIGAWRAADKHLALDVFGLYAGYQNTATVTARLSGCWATPARSHSTMPVRPMGALSHSTARRSISPT
jgi:hypothetical protein